MWDDGWRKYKYDDFIDFTNYIIRYSDQVVKDKKEIDEITDTEMRKKIEYDGEYQDYLDKVINFFKNKAEKNFEKLERKVLEIDILEINKILDSEQFQKTTDLLDIYESQELAILEIRNIMIRSFIDIFSDSIRTIINYYIWKIILLGGDVNNNNKTLKLLENNYGLKESSVKLYHIWSKINKNKKIDFMEYIANI